MARETNREKTSGDVIARDRLLELAGKIYDQFENEVIPSVSLQAEQRQI